MLMVASVLLSRVLGFFREWILAQTIGATAATDVYLASFTVPDFLNYLLAAGALNVSFIPILSAYVGEDKKARGNEIYRTIATCMCGLQLVLVVLGEIFAPQLALIVAPGFTPEQLEQLVFLLRIILPAQFFFFWGGLANGVQQTFGRFIYSALAPLIYNTCIIAFGLGLYRQIGVAAFSVGVLAGAFLGHGVLQWWGLRAIGYSVRPLWNFEPEIKDAFRRYLWMSLPIMLGFSLVVTDEWISKYLGSSMGPGAVSWLTFARTEMRIPIAIIGQAAGIASFPYLSRLWAQKNYQTFGDTFVVEIQKIWALGPCAAILLVTHALPLTHFIYGGGKMTPQDLQITAEILQWMGLGVLFWILQVLLSRGFYATQTTWFPSILGSVLTVLALPLYWFLGERYGVQGLAMAGTAGITVYVLILGIYLRKHVLKAAPEYSFKKLYRFCASWTVVVVLLAAVAYGISQLGIYQGTRLSGFLDVIAATAVLGLIAIGLLRTVFKRMLGEALF